MAKMDKTTLEDIYKRYRIEDGKELRLNYPKVEVTVEENSRKVKKTFWDITEYFQDFEEGKVMGRIHKFEQ